MHVYTRPDQVMHRCVREDKTIRIFLREKFTQDQGAQAQAHYRPKSMIMRMLTIIRSTYTLGEPVYKGL